VDIYHIGDTTYFGDSVSQRWMVTPSHRPLEQEKYLAEINPLSMIKITKLEEVQYLGPDKKVSGRPYLIRARAQVNNAFLNTYWNNFCYQFWIDRGSQYIRQFSLEASHRQRPQDRLAVKVEMWDFNGRNITIRPPQ